MSNANSACSNKLDTKPSINSSFLTPIAQHIQDVLQFLANPIQSDENIALDNANVIHTDPLKQSPNLLRLLLIGEENVLNSLTCQLSNTLTLLPSDSCIIDAFNASNTRETTDTALHITQISPQEFLQSDFHERFDLGVNLALIGVEGGSTKAYMPEQCLKIATRLRDLFAEQSLIYLSKQTKLNLRGLGYVQSEMPSMAATIDLDWQAWQFNLYDYKPTPNWLNAKYWANPENFDKYRW